MTSDDYIRHNANFYNSIASSFSDLSKIPIELFEYQKIERDKFTTLVRSGKVLDAGCGSGLQTMLLSKYPGFQLTGIDISANQLNNARQLCPNATFLTMDLRKLDFPAESFEGIWANASLIHVSNKDLPTTLKEFCRILKKGGYCYTSFKQKEPQKTIDQPHAITYYYEIDDIKYQFINAGFNVLECYIYNEHERVIKGREVDWVVIFAQKG